MNWLQKLSSVTFTLEQSEKIAQPKNISSLATDLSIWAHENAPRFLLSDQWQMIDMDGLEWSNTTGTINWYFQPEELGGEVPDEQTNDIPMYMNQWYQEELATLGFRVNIRGPERSKAFEEWHVYRMDILDNPTAGYPTLPSMNISNTNAAALFGMLNMPMEFQGSIELGDLKQRMTGLSQAHMREFTEDPVDTGGHINFGRDMGKLQGYLNELSQIIDSGLQNGFTKLQWG
jgi:hypothetical protein